MNEARCDALRVVLLSFSVLVHPTQRPAGTRMVNSHPNGTAGRYSTSGSLLSIYTQTRNTRVFPHQDSCRQQRGREKEKPLPAAVL